jgi:hypothetical protein
MAFFQLHVTMLKDRITENDDYLLQLSVYIYRHNLFYKYTSRFIFAWSAFRSSTEDGWPSLNMYAREFIKGIVVISVDGQLEKILLIILQIWIQLIKMDYIGRKQSWCSFRCYSSICLEALRKKGHIYLTRIATLTPRLNPGTPWIQYRSVNCYSVKFRELNRISWLCLLTVTTDSIQLLTSGSQLHISSAKSVSRGPV